MDKMSLKKVILDVENIEFEIYSVQSTIEYFHALLTASDEIIVKSMETIINRTIDITGEYEFQTYHSSHKNDNVRYPAYILTIPGPQNTIVEIDSDVKLVYVYCRGKLIETSEIIPGKGYKFSNKIIPIDILVRNLRTDFPEIYGNVNDPIKIASYNGYNMFIITDDLTGRMYNKKGQIIYKYDAALVKELFDKCCGCIVLSDGMSVCFHQHESGKNFYRIIRPI